MPINQAKEYLFKLVSVVFLPFHVRATPILRIIFLNLVQGHLKSLFLLISGLLLDFQEFKLVYILTVFTLRYLVVLNFAKYVFSSESINKTMTDK